MNRDLRWGVSLAAAALLLQGCSSRNETIRTAPAPADSKEELYTHGHRLLQAGEFDSAIAVLARVRALDSTYRPPLQDLALLSYDRALRAPEGSSVRRTEARRALGYLTELERLGQTDEDTYERMTETARLAGDREAFLRHARGAAGRYPSDRRAFNLALALGEAARHREAAEVVKQAIVRYPSSSFQGGFHRVLGTAYLRMDRDQSAERIFAEGVRRVDRMLEEWGTSSPGTAAGPDGRRMREDRTGMLQALKKLHRTYGRTREREEVERRLRAEGAGQ